MSIEIHTPDIGTDEVEVTEIMVKVGDKVNIEESLIVVEGEKASMEIPSPLEGVVKEIKVSVGDKIQTGKLIMLLDTEKNTTKTIHEKSSEKYLKSSEEYLQKDKTKNKNTDQENTELKKVFIPNIGADEVEVTEIMVKVGDKVNIEESLIVVEGEKASMEIPSPLEGVVKEIKVSRGHKVKTGSLIMIFSINVTKDLKINEGNELKSIETKIASTKPDPLSEKKSNILEIEKNTYVHATPLVRRLAREFSINLSNVNGTGRKGRILREDIQDYIKEAVKQFEVKRSSQNNFSAFTPWPKVDFSKFGEIEKIDLTHIQKISSTNLSRNWMMIPHVTIMEDADVTEAESFRKQQNKKMEKLKKEIKITLLVFVMKAVSQALKEMPRFNSSLSKEAHRLTLKKYIHIGIAVDTPNGLVVPVIRDVNKKGIIDLSKELTEISKKARIGKLSMSDMQGGSITISNLGGIGTKNFTPIINAPEVAIIGLSRLSTKPVWNGNEFISRLMLPISLSFDHRVIDGADGARFIVRIAEIMSDIRQLIM